MLFWGNYTYKSWYFDWERPHALNQGNLYPHLNFQISHNQHFWFLTEEKDTLTFLVTSIPSYPSIYIHIFGNYILHIRDRPPQTSCKSKSISWTIYQNKRKQTVFVPDIAILSLSPPIDIKPNCFLFSINNILFKKLMPQGFAFETLDKSSAYAHLDILLRLVWTQA